MLEDHAAAIVAAMPQTDSLAAKVRRAIASRISQGDVQIENVAHTLAMSTRSLQRRLAGEGVSYQELLDEVRRNAASSYLAQNRLAIGEVGYLLGYSEPAAFHRAFKRWHGVTPQAYRDQFSSTGTAQNASK